MLWQATTPATPDAPTVRVARSGAEVVIRYRTVNAGDDVRLPLVIWASLASATRAGRLDGLGEAWTPWMSSGGRVRLHDGHVELGYGYLHGWGGLLPEPVWRALADGVRDGTLDDLPHADPQELVDAAR
ncbi:hypothetical protein [Frankia tisae]|uniref:hypothetical protein n=1 Tax=Frankia tisae TaxID=2950104 RepID=UPI0021C1CB72|nr:hypothetical protein [Frankia tisae]